MRGRGDEFFFLVGSEDHQGDAEQVDREADGEAKRLQPGCGPLGRKEPFHQADRNRDAPDDVDKKHVHGPGGTNAQLRDVTAIEQAESEIVWIEQRLRGEALFDEGVGQAECEDRGPTAATPSRGLAHDSAPPPYIKAMIGKSQSWPKLRLPSRYSATSGAIRKSEMAGRRRCHIGKLRDVLSKSDNLKWFGP